MMPWGAAAQRLDSGRNDARPDAQAARRAGRGRNQNRNQNQNQSQDWGFRRGVPGEGGYAPS